MTYNQALDFLYKQLPMYQRVGAAAYKANLDNTIALLELLKNPQYLFKSIHIAGTNGKGSVSHLIASVLQEAGYKTALYTSPHLKDFRERIKINNKVIGKTFVKDFVSQYYSDFLKIEPSFFEMTVGLAFDYFAKENIDIAVIETGLGGRLDSTNVITPELSIITNIAFDHVALLGNSLEKIAIEKAGIIKKGIPVIVGENQIELRDVFEKKAELEQTNITQADTYFSILEYSNTKNRKEFVSFKIRNNISKKTYALSCPLLGLYQKKNFITTISALEKLKEIGYTISDEAIYRGFVNVLKNTGLKGRWQILSRKPLTICDTGHNEAGITEIVKQLQTYQYNQLHIVLGMVNDKDINSILRLLPKNAVYYFCKPSVPRGLDANDLSKNANKFGLQGNVFNSVKDAFECAKANAVLNDLIFIGGSTFVVAEVV